MEELRRSQRARAAPIEQDIVEVESFQREFWGLVTEDVTYSDLELVKMQADRLRDAHRQYRMKALGFYMRRVDESRQQAVKVKLD